MSRIPFVKFVEQPVRLGHVTQRWWVNGRTGNCLGIVKWYSPWRRYVFYPSANTLFDHACLVEIEWFLMDHMARHIAEKEERDD